MIRSMREEDISAVSAIERTVFSDPWPESAFHDCLTVPSRVNLVLVDSDSNLIGYLCAQCAADEIQIHNIAVAPQWHRQGHGTHLLQAAEDEGLTRGALCVVLDVRASNEAALSMYARLGYRRIGRRRDYYHHPVCDALVLFKPLTGASDAVRSKELTNGMVS
jgi:ribosomal-protein-alanine N-acetyltransferase